MPRFWIGSFFAQRKVPIRGHTLTPIRGTRNRFLIPSLWGVDRFCLRSGVRVHWWRVIGRPYNPVFRTAIWSIYPVSRSVSSQCKTTLASSLSFCRLWFFPPSNPFIFNSAGFQTKLQLLVLLGCFFTCQIGLIPLMVLSVPIGTIIESLPRRSLILFKKTEVKKLGLSQGISMRDSGPSFLSIDFCGLIFWVTVRSSPRTQIGH